MSRRIAAGIAAASLALGILGGAAGAIVVRDATSPVGTTAPAHMAAMNGMHAMMAGQMGTEMMSQMMEMMGSWSMGADHMQSGPKGPGSGMELHRQHHPDGL